jgi:hypothetical protein
MFCSPNQWRATKFPRDKFYDSKSKGGAVLMHSKVCPISACHRSILIQTR